MDELHDAGAAERLEHESPDEFLRRREFLGRTAAAAGLATGLGAVLPAETLVAEAARRQRRVRLPAPKDMPVDTFVVLMMENRSFDHYLGWMPEADGRQAGLTYLDGTGKAHQTHRLAPDFQGCGKADPDHSWTGGREQLAGGRCDGFMRVEGNDEFAIGYYAEPDLPFLGHAAKAFTTYDRFFCSLLASTFPNREYMHAATSYGKRDNSFPDPPGFPDTTIWAALEAKQIPCTYYFSDLPASGLWGMPALRRSARVDQFYAQAQAGTLPNVSFVDPFFGAIVGEPGGFSGDEHPHGDIRTGQAFMADVAHAFMESPQFARGALFIVYDEWGGFFDHVRPPRVPDDRNARKLEDDYGQMGFRIPAVCISPWVRRGHVSHTVFGFESILKMIEYRFGLKPLNRRDAYAHNIATSFDFRSKPQLEPPALPDPFNVVSQPCGTSGAGAERAHEHDMLTLATSGWLERFGFHYEPPRLEHVFRQPDKLRRARA